MIKEKTNGKNQLNSITRTIRYCSKEEQKKIHLKWFFFYSLTIECTILVYGFVSVCLSVYYDRPREKNHSPDLCTLSIGIPHLQPNKSTSWKNWKFWRLTANCHTLAQKLFFRYSCLHKKMPAYFFSKSWPLPAWSGCTIETIDGLPWKEVNWTGWYRKNSCIRPNWSVAKICAMGFLRRAISIFLYMCKCACVCVSV